MTNEEAKEIRLHLIAEFQQSGFADIVEEIQTRLQEDYVEKEFSRSELELLSYFLSESIDVLTNRSNDSFPQLLEELNKYGSGFNSVERIEVEYLDEANNVATFDMKDLPSYRPIILELNSILEEMRNEG